MRLIVSLAVVVVLLVAGCQKAGEPANVPFDQGPPTVPDKFVLEPTIETAQKTFSAGTAFAAKHPDLDRPVVLTCLHIFGTAGGYPTDIPPLDLPRVVKKVTFEDKFTEDELPLVAGPMIPIPDSAPLDNPSRAGDIAAMWVVAPGPVAVGTLSTTPTRVGQPVWLASRLAGAAEPAKKLHRGTVTSQADNLLTYRFDEGGLQLRATSGSPVLDAKGEVVAIHLGGGEDRGRTMGVGNPTAVFLPHLLAACKQNPMAGAPPGK